ncbi:homoserine dehydrogenase [Acidobacteriota bacterium]
MQKINIILMGYGNVGKAFLELLQHKEEVCQEKYGLDLRVAAVIRRQKGLIYCQPQKPARVLKKRTDCVAGESNLIWDETVSLDEAIDTFQPGVLVECTPTDSITGGPGLQHIRLALDRDWNVVTANKGPLVVDYQGLMDKARQKNRSIRISGATAAALPTLDVAQKSLAGAEILKFEGIVNGTTNFILTKIGEGSNFSDALNEAQEKGIAETDPTQDVEGWDTAYKVLLLTNAIFLVSKSLSDVNVQGITNIDPSLIQRCQKEGGKLKLLGRMSRRGEDFSLEVVLEAIHKTHPLFYVDGTEKGICFETDTMSTITVIGGKSDPIGTAAAMLKDLINIYT